MCTISRQENDLNLKTNLMQSLVVNTSHSFPHSCLITGLVTRLTRWVPLVDQELLTPLEHLGSSRVFSGVLVTRSLCYVYALQIVVCPFVRFLLAIVLSVLS